MRWSTSRQHAANCSRSAATAAPIALGALGLRTRKAWWRRVQASLKANAAAFGDQAKPWFRAPSGYVAPWMAQPLAEAGVVLDSSINPSRLVRRKAGPARNWTDVAHAMEEAGVVERPWHVQRGWPTCGPALHLPGLAGRARRAWRNLPPVLNVEGIDAVAMPGEDVTTVYWHVTDLSLIHI